MSQKIFDARLKSSLRRIKKFALGDKINEKEVLNAPLEIISYGENAVFGNILIDGSAMFSGNSGQVAEHWVTEQIKIMDPKRMDVPLLIYTKDEGFVYQRTNELDQEYGENLIGDPKPEHNLPKNIVPTLVVFGLAFAHHIHEAIKKLNIHHLIVVETNVSLVKSFLLSIEWSLIEKFLARPGRRFAFVYHPDPVQASMVLTQYLRDHSAAHLYGASFWKYHDSPQINIAVEVFMSFLNYLRATQGYVIDEVRQSRQTAQNLKITDQIIEDHAQQIDGIAMVVGAGPSLDKSIEIIRKYKDKCVIFACGSGLSRLIKSGIWPDFYVELETNPIVIDFLQTLNLPEKFFETVTYIGSAGVPPGAISMFKNRALFLRDSSTSSNLFGGKCKPLKFSNPFVGNAGLAVTLALGFKNILLFGLDCGFIPKQAYHAQATYYETDDVKELTSADRLFGENLSRQSKELLTTPEHQVIEQYESVDGRILHATKDLSQSRVNLIDAIKDKPSANVYQVGDGARLGGAINVIADEFVFPNAEQSKESALEEIRSRLTAQPKLNIFYKAQLLDMIRKAERIKSQLLKAMPLKIKTLDEWLVLAMSINTTLLSEGGGGNTAVSAMGGSLITYANVIFQRACSISDEKDRERFIDLAFEKLKLIISDMTEHVNAELSNI